MHKPPEAPALKILLLLPEYGNGGAERVFATHSELLSGLFHVTECVFVNQTNTLAYNSSEGIILDVGKGYNFLDKLLKLHRRVRRLDQIVCDRNIDLVISHMEGANYVNAFQDNRAKKILVLHGAQKRDPNIKGFLGWLRRKILTPLACHRADLTICVSQGIAHDLISTGVAPHKLCVLRNYFDCDRIEKLSHEDARHLNFFRKNRVIVNLARLSLQKNQAALIQLFSKLKNVQNLYLAFCGDGELQNDLVSLAKHLNLNPWTPGSGEELHSEHRVLFMGYLANPFPYVRHATLSILTSHNEGFPLALCESMLCSTPVVAVDCPTGPREIIAPASSTTQQPPILSPYGLLIPELTTESSFTANLNIAQESILDLLSNIEALQTLRQNGRELIRREYSRSNGETNLLQAIYQVLE